MKNLAILKGRGIYIRLTENQFPHTQEGNRTEERVATVTRKPFAYTSMFLLTNTSARKKEVPNRGAFEYTFRNDHQRFAKVSESISQLQPFSLPKGLILGVGHLPIGIGEHQTSAGGVQVYLGVGASESDLCV